MASRVACGTDGKFQIRCFAPAGSAGPAGPRAVQPDRRVRSYRHYYYVARTDLRLRHAIPFVSTPVSRRLMYHGGGLELMRELFSPTTSSSFRPATPRADGRLVPQGYTPSPIRRPEIPHRRFRGPGADQARRRTAADRRGDIYPALEKAPSMGRWVAPMTTSGRFNKIAQHTTPRWWRAGRTVAPGDSPSGEPAKSYQAILEAPLRSNLWMVAIRRAEHAALRTLSPADAAEPYSKEILEACYTAANQLYDETSARTPPSERLRGLEAVPRRDQPVVPHRRESFDISPGQVAGRRSRLAASLDSRGAAPRCRDLDPDLCGVERCRADEPRSPARPGDDDGDHDSWISTPGRAPYWAELLTSGGAYAQGEQGEPDGGCINESAG